MTVPDFTIPDRDGMRCIKLDSDDTALVEAYEKALFRAFPPGSSSSTDSIWTYDRKTRRARCMPPEQVTIYLALRNATILASMAINDDLSQPLECERIGFTIDRSKTGLAEGTALFSTTQSIEGSMALRKLGQFVFADLHARGIGWLYGTCTERLFRLYGFMGWKIQDELMFAEGKEYLIGAPIEDIKPV